jgi:hypothetical protein
MISERRINRKDYVEVKIKGEWVLEHIYLVEQFIKRKLFEKEVIHHIDGNRQNNNLSNLMIFPNQKEHKSFENKIKQFGWTRYHLEEVKNRFNNFK